jgi:predicted permease
VVVEVALSLVVLVGAGLMLRSLARIAATEPGFESENVLTLRFALPPERYAEPERVARFYDRVLAQVAGLPGVRCAGIISLLPVQDWGWNGNFQIDGREVVSAVDQPFAEHRVVSPGYFEALRIPLIAGRSIDDSDRPGAPGVALVNQTLARLYWPERSPLGEHIRFTDEGEWIEVIGVVGDVRNAGLEREVQGELYLAVSQDPPPQASLVVRSDVAPAALAATIAAEVRKLDPDQPIHLVRTMDEVLAQSVARLRFNTLLLGIFGATALALCIAGVYAVLSHAVAQRTREIGLRMALGADRRVVTVMVIRQGLRLSAIGAAVGAVASLALMRLLESQLHGVAPTDPLTMVAVTALLLVISLLACSVPAHRASRVDPMVALRWE